MPVSDIIELLSLVYRYYPRKCSYTDHNYKMSAEYFRYMNIIENLTRRTQINENLFSSIVRCADGYCVMQREHSDYSTYPSIQYTILLHKNHPLLDDDVDLILSLGGRRLDLELLFSLLGSYCYYYIVETVGEADTLKWQFNILSEKNLSSHEREMIFRLRSKVNSLGYKLLESDHAHEAVPEVETELINSGEVTVFNCLFSGIKVTCY